jgi:hypothetical protein
MTNDHLHPVLSAKQIHPIVLTTLGRTGSNLMIALLGSHPNIIAYEAQRLEPRYAAYWLQIAMNFNNQQRRRPRLSGAPGLLQRFFPGGASVPWPLPEDADALRRFCVRSLQEYYSRVALAQGKRDVSFFCEKFLPDRFTEDFLKRMPSAKEIFLVRDFRDMVSSIFAFNRKRGTIRFGREKFASDEEYITCHVGPVLQSLRQSWKKRKKTSILVRYEDLILETPAALQGLFQYLGLDWADPTIDRVIAAAKNTRPAAQTAHTTSQTPESSIGRYGRDLSPALADLCETTFKKALKTFGYPLRSHGR